MPGMRLDELAQLIEGVASESPGPRISGVKPIEFAGETDITYVTDAKYAEKLTESAAGAVIVPPGIEPGTLPFIQVDNPEFAYARLTAVFYPYPAVAAGIAPNASVDPDATVSPTASIGPFAVIGRGSSIGDNVVVGAHSVIGDDSHVCENTRIFPHVTIYDNVRVGKRVIIHSGTVIGSDGFGFAPGMTPDGRPVALKKYHSGSVEIGDDVEIGALCAVDKALAGVTTIGAGVKIDNLVQIAHNVHVGEGSVIAAQVGIAGSSSFGRYGMIGGQAGIRDHVKVGDKVVLATRVGVYRDVADGAVMGGAVPAMPYNLFLRVQSALKRLPDMFERIKKVERQVKALSKDDE